PAGIAANQQHSDSVELTARIEQVIAWIAEVFDTHPDTALADFRRWIVESGLPGLSSLGVTEAHIVATAKSAASSSSMKANPVALSAATVELVMRQSL
ncbi:MAG: alcohol dehydrogenase, partial [Marinobacter sp. 34-60-7]